MESCQGSVRVWRVANNAHLGNIEQRPVGGAAKEDLWASHSMVMITLALLSRTDIASNSNNAYQYWPNIHCIIPLSTISAQGTGAAFVADSSTHLSKVRLKRQSTDKLAQFQLQVDREKQAESPPVDSLDIWATPGNAKKVKGGESIKKPKTEKSEAEKEDERNRLFRPRGVVLDARLDKEHWLTFGMEKKNIPVFFSSSYAFLSEDPVQTPVRLESAERIRLGGLLWPEARERWAETAFVTRENSGKGQIILFAQEANFRAYFLGAGRLMQNALILGPGMGTSWPAPW